MIDAEQLQDSINLLGNMPLDLFILSFGYSKLDKVFLDLVIDFIQGQVGSYAPVHDKKLCGLHGGYPIAQCRVDRHA